MWGYLSGFVCCGRGLHSNTMPKTKVDKKMGPPTKSRRDNKERPDLRKARDIRRLNMYKNKLKRDEKGEVCSSVRFRVQE